MDYSHYTARQLAQDDHFQTWVLRPTPEHRAFWEGWLASYPHQRAEVERARALLLGWHFEEPSVSPEEISHLRQRVMRSADRVPYTPGRTARRGYYGRVAASVAGVFALLALLYWLVRPAQEWTAYRTDYGEVKTLFLPDSTEVTLNANSSLRFPRHWEAAGSRTVWLEGEAYFKVAKQPISTSPGQTSWRKFLVNANELVISVVGTRFNVYARPTKTEVVLAEGIIEIDVDTAQNQAPPSLRMQPGEKVTYQRQQLSQQVVEPNDYPSWREQRLQFEEVPLYQVAQTIEETYGVTVVFVSQDLRQQLFTGTVPSSNLDVLLEALTGIYQLQIVRQDDQLIISKHDPAN